MILATLQSHCLPATVANFWSDEVSVFTSTRFCCWFWRHPQRGTPCPEKVERSICNPGWAFQQSVDIGIQSSNHCGRQLRGIGQLSPLVSKGLFSSFVFLLWTCREVRRSCWWQNLAAVERKCLWKIRVVMVYLQWSWPPWWWSCEWSDWCWQVMIVIATTMLTFININTALGGLLHNGLYDYIMLSLGTQNHHPK